jgi:hypothetical protein
VRRRRRCYVDGRVGRDPIRGLEVCEHGRAQRHLRPERLDKTRRQRVAIRIVSSQVAQADDGDRKHEEKRGRRRPGSRIGAATAEEAPGEQRCGTPAEREPYRPRWALPFDLGREGDLEADAEPEREDAADEPEPAGEDGRTGQRERQGKEEGEPPGLRERAEIGERGEEARHEEHDQHGHRPAQHERCPAPPGRKHSGRNGEQRRDHGRAASRDRLGREPERVAEDIEVGGVLRDAARTLSRRRRERLGLRDRWPEPGEEEARRDEQHDQGRGEPPPL